MLIETERLKDALKEKSFCRKISLDVVLRIIDAQEQIDSVPIDWLIEYSASRCISDIIIKTIRDYLVSRKGNQNK